MKWNWGTKIGLLYSGFVAFILFMVYLSFGQQYDLVTEDYYAAEINYQETIDSKSRASSLNEPLRATIEGNQLLLHFPGTTENIEGSLEAFRPSDQSKDFSKSFELVENKYAIPLQQFVKGKYYLKVHWSVAEEKYYHELSIIIP